MKKRLICLATLCMLVLTVLIQSGHCTAETLPAALNDLSNDELLSLLAQVQSEVVARRIDKSAKLPAGTFVGGRDIPLGEYILINNGTENQHGIIELSTAKDTAGKYTHKLYEHYMGDDEFQIFITIEKGETLSLPFPCILKIAPKITFE